MLAKVRFAVHGINSRENITERLVLRLRDNFFHDNLRTI